MVGIFKMFKLIIRTINIQTLEVVLTATYKFHKQVTILRVQEVAKEKIEQATDENNFACYEIVS